MNRFVRPLGPPIHHYDLYRLKESELSRLDLEDSFGSAVSLIEWSERLGINDDVFKRLEFKFLFQVCDQKMTWIQH